MTSNAFKVRQFIVLLKTKKATLFLGKQTHSKWAKQKKCFKLVIWRLMLLKFVNLLFYWKPKKPTLFAWTFWEQPTHSKFAKQRKISFKFIGRFCVRLFFVKKRFFEVESVTIVSNYWSVRLGKRKLKIHRASDLQSHITVTLIYTEQLRRFKVKGFRAYLSFGWRLVGIMCL